MSGIARPKQLQFFTCDEILLSGVKNDVLHAVLDARNSNVPDLSRCAKLE
jgi:hypothetical protein